MTRVAKFDAYDPYGEAMTPTDEDFEEARAAGIEPGKFDYLDLDAEAARLRARGAELGRRMDEVMKSLQGRRYTMDDLRRAMDQAGVREGYVEDMQAATFLRFLRAANGRRQ